jgi:hypothetical protein
MRQLSIGGKVYEVEEKYYLDSINHLSKGYYVLAEAYHNYHVSGFADLDGIFQAQDVGQDEIVKAISNQIDDQMLSKAFDGLKNHLQELKELDGQIADWLISFVGLPPVQDKKHKALLKRRLKKIIISGPDGRLQGPIWSLQPEYQAFVERSKMILVVMGDAQQQIDQRIQQLLGSSIET